MKLQRPSQSLPMWVQVSRAWSASKARTGLVIKGLLNLKPARRLGCADPDSKANLPYGHVGDR